MAEHITTIYLPAQCTDSDYTTACQEAYAALRAERETIYDDITPIELQSAGEWRTYLHCDSGRNAYVSIQAEGI